MVIAHVSDDVVLALAAATLFCTAVTDLRHLKIRNEFILILVGLFLLHQTLIGGWTDLYSNLGAALLVFAPAALFYSNAKMGGGDVKILTVAFLWTGLESALLLSILILIFVCAHTIIARFGWTGDRVDGHLRIPLAPSVAAALVCVLFLAAIAE